MRAVHCLEKTASKIVYWRKFCVRTQVSQRRWIDPLKSDPNAKSENSKQCRVVHTQRQFPSTLPQLSIEVALFCVMIQNRPPTNTVPIQCCVLYYFSACMHRNTRGKVQHLLCHVLPTWPRQNGSDQQTATEKGRKWAVCSC